MKTINRRVGRFWTTLILSAYQINSYATGSGDPPSRGPLPQVDWFTYQNAGQVLAPIAVGIGVLLLVTTYLNSSVTKEVSLRYLKRRNAELQAKLDTAISQGARPPANPDMEPQQENHLTRVRNEFGVAKDNLHEHLVRVNRRANFNLGIGITISLAAIVLLLTQLWGPPPQSKELPDLFVAYFPRFITCVFIEILAFFFLRLYRTSLVETRAYEIDLQELSARKVAFESTWDQGNADTPRIRIALALIEKTIQRPTESEPSIDPAAALDLFDKLLKIVSKKDKPDD